MAPIDSFLTALVGGSSGANVDDIMGFQRSVAENNILNDLAPAVMGARFNTSSWSPEQTLGVTAGQAFLGSLLSGMARNDAAEQFSQLASVLPQLYDDPMSVSTPEGVDPEAFGALKLSSIARNTRAKADTGSSLIKELLGVKLKGMEAKESALGKALGEAEGDKLLYGGEFKNPNSPQNKLARELESNTYNRITGLPQYKLFSDVESNFKALQDLASQDSRAADLGLISTIARIRDPNSVVREGEIVMNADTQAYMDKFLGNWRSVATGESRLNEFDKAKIIGSVVPKYNELGTSYLSSRNPLLQALEQQGGSRTNIPTMEFSPFDIKTLIPNTTDLQAFVDTAKSLGISREEGRALWESRQRR